MNKILLFLILFISGLLFTGCSTTVTAEDVYRSVDADTGLSGAKNITVELSENGMIVRGPEISVLARITANSFALDTEPEDAKLKYTVADIVLGGDKGGIVQKIHLVLGPDSSLPALLPMKGSMGFVPEDYGLVPGAVNSQNITIKINPSVGHTDIAGLRFTREVILNIWEDGSIEVDKEGVEATDKDGVRWISKKVNFDGKRAILMVKP